MKNKLTDILAAITLAQEGVAQLITAMDDSILTEAEAKEDLAEICSNLKNAIL